MQTVNWEIFTQSMIRATPHSDVISSRFNEFYRKHFSQDTVNDVVFSYSDLESDNTFKKPLKMKFRSPLTASKHFSVIYIPHF